MDLAASNSYTGPTTVSAGILRLSNTAALPGGTASLGGTSNLVLDGGVIELASGNFARSIGTAAGQVQFTANGGGFGALGGTRTVNLGGGSAQVAWGSGGFVPAGAALVLGAISSDSLVDFQNPINLTSSGGTVEADAGASLVNGRLSGPLSGAGGFTKIGFGTLELTANNTYSGATTVVSGVLRLSNSGALPGGTANTGGASNLVLDGGVVELASSDFTRSLGTGAAQVQFVGRGGFGAAARATSSTSAAARHKSPGAAARSCLRDKPWSWARPATTRCWIFRTPSILATPRRPLKWTRAGRFPARKSAARSAAAAASSRLAPAC